MKLPCVVMVCGLLWLGEGLLSSIGLAFNDALGRALAQQGMATVQLHTPQRHLARTRLMELALTAALPLCLLPGLRALLLATDLAMLATSKKDLYLLMILLLPGLLDVLAAALAVPARPRNRLKTWGKRWKTSRIPGVWMPLGHVEHAFSSRDAAPGPAGLVPLRGAHGRGPHRGTAAARRLPFGPVLARGAGASWPPGLPEGGLRGRHLGAWNGNKTKN